MRHSLPSIAFTGLLAGCANVHERPIALGSIGLGADDVLRVEREYLELRTRNGARLDMYAIDAVEGLRCVTLKRTGANTPRCDYRLHYRKTDGRSATKTRRKRFFERGHDGRWESVIIVMSA